MGWSCGRKKKSKILNKPCDFSNPHFPHLPNGSNTLPTAPRGSREDKSRCRVKLSDLSCGYKGGLHHAAGPQGTAGSGSPSRKRLSHRRETLHLTEPARMEGCPSPSIPPAGTALHPSNILTSAPTLHGASLPGPCRRLLPQDPGVHRSVHQEAQGGARPLLGRTATPTRGSSCPPPSSHASLGGPALSPPGLQARPHARRRRSWEATEAPRSRRDKVAPPEREIELHLPEPSARHGASPAPRPTGPRGTCVRQPSAVRAVCAARALGGVRSGAFGLLGSPFLGNREPPPPRG